MINGVTSLYDKVYLIRRRSSELEQYNADSFALEHRFIVNELVSPFDVLSSLKYSCLYISDCDTNSIHRVELHGKTTKWLIGGEPHGLSVTKDGWNVIVAFHKALQLCEFTTHGDLVRTISLPSDCLHPLHAAQMFNDCYVICHGWGEDQRNRVCIVSGTGRMRKFYSCTTSDGSTENQYSYPACLRLYVDASGYICLLNAFHKSVMLFDANLKLIRNLISGCDINAPYRFCFDEVRGRMYIADVNDKSDDETLREGEMLVYNVKDI